MATDYRFIAGGTTYYLKPSGQARTAFTGTGTPWTASSTTPFAIQQDDVTGPRLSLRPAVGQRIVGIGPAIATLTTTDITYETIEREIPIGISATTRENALDAKQVLMRALDTWSVGLPAQLSVKPDGVTAAVYWEILGASWADTDISWNDEMRATLLRGVITLLVRPFGGKDADSGDLIFSSQSFNNTVTTDTRSMGSTGAGDLTNEGQPLNLAISPATTQARFLMASVAERIAVTGGFGSTTVTTSFTSVGSAGLNLFNLMTRPNLAVRLVVDATISSSGSTDYIDGIKADLQLNSGGTYHTAEFQGLSTTAARRLFDFGDIPIPILPFDGHDTANVSLTVTLSMRKSSAVNTVSCLINYVEVLLYWEYCTISTVGVTSSEALVISSYPVQTGRTSLPYPEAQARRVGGNQVKSFAAIEGEVPRYRRGASLWLASTDDDVPGGVHNASATFSVGARQCALYRSARAD